MIHGDPFSKEIQLLKNLLAHDKVDATSFRVPWSGSQLLVTAAAAAAGPRSEHKELGR